MERTERLCISGGALSFLLDFSDANRPTLPIGPDPQVRLDIELGWQVLSGQMKKLLC